MRIPAVPRTLVAAIALAGCLARPASAQIQPPLSPEVDAALNRVVDMWLKREWRTRPTDFQRLATRAFEAARRRRNLADQQETASWLVSANRVLKQPQKNDALLADYQRAAQRCAAARDWRGEADTLAVIAGILRAQGRYADALSRLQTVVDISRKHGDRLREARAWMSIALMVETTPRQRMDACQKALALFQACGNRWGEAETLMAIAETPGDDPAPTRRRHLLESIAIYRRIGDRPTHQQGHRSALGWLHFSVGALYDSVSRQPDEAIPHYQEALRRARVAGDGETESLTLSRLSALFKAQPDRAIAYAERAAQIGRASGFTYGTVTALRDVADIHRDNGRTAKALEVYQEALALAPRSIPRSADLEPSITSRIADVHFGQGQGENALRYYRRTVDLWERSLHLGFNATQRTRFLATRLWVYYRLVDLLLQSGRVEEAFATAQKTKARSLLDQMAKQRIDVRHILSPQETRAQRQLLDRADALNVAMVREGVENQVGSKKRFQALGAKLKATEAQLQAMNETLFLRYPKLEQVQIPRTATLADLGTVVPEDTALLEYVVTSDRSVWVFVVTVSGHRARVAARKLPADYAEIRAAIAALRDACSHPARSVAAPAEALHAQVIAPVEEQLAGKRRLIVCPDGALWDVPFQALMSGGEFLAERHEIAYAYSATGARAETAPRAGRRRASKTLLALANPNFGASSRFGDLADVPGQRPFDTPSRPIDSPSRPIDTPSRPIDSPSRPLDSPSRPLDSPSRPLDSPSRPIDAPSRPIDAPSRAFDAVSRDGGIAPLPGTQREADALRRDFPGAVVHTGAAAQEATAKAQAGSYRYLHFATHGFVNDAAPLLSSIVLAQPPPGSREDGFLTAREIFGMDLTAEMVVLSACNTARGEVRTGDGIVGLTWALFVAGCPTQVVSQWSVDDASTATLMETFYANLTRRKMAKGAALRQASLTLMRDPRFRHPYYWAPFVLVGDWR